ncbi:hypothetical protein EG829_23185, partial [bacterium]|nr:hypothetical protein [bacterium]
MHFSAETASLAEGLASRIKEEQRMQWFSNMKMKMKLLTGFSAVAVICAIVGVIGFIGARQLDAQIKEVADVRLPSVLGLEILNEAQTAIRVAERSSLLAEDVKDVKQQEANLKNAWERAEKGWKIYEPLTQTKEEEALWKQFVPSWDSWKEDHQKVMELVIAGKREEAKQISFDQADDSFRVSEELLAKIIDLNIKVADDAKSEAKAVAARVQALSTIASVIGVLLSVGIALLVTRIIMRQLGGDPAYVVDIAQAVAKGDLTIDIPHDSR